MKNKDLKTTLLQDKRTVFTLDEVAILLNSSDRANLKSRVNYYVKEGLLENPRKGIYVKPDYNKLELATKIYNPCYISLETALYKENIINQYYETIFVVSYLSREIEVDGQKIRFRKIKDQVLYNADGVRQDPYPVAEKERAFLDALYLYKDYSFDNLDPLNKERLFSLASLYENKALIGRLNKIFNGEKEDL